MLQVGEYHIPGHNVAGMRYQHKTGHTIHGVGPVHELTIYLCHPVGGKGSLCVTGGEALHLAQTLRLTNDHTDTSRAA